MKKTWLFTFSILIAILIASYSKKPNYSYTTRPAWKTFVKKNETEIRAYKTTSNEMKAARINNHKREIAQVKEQEINQDDDTNTSIKNPDFLYRFNRVLVGDIQKKNYQDEQVELEMVNKENHNWKEILGNELIRFHNENTKVMIKEEFPVIKIENGKGIYLEQVVISYLFSSGRASSYRALIDSESGTVIETWDKTIHENGRTSRAGITIPTDPDNGIKSSK